MDVSFFCPFFNIVSMFIVFIFRTYIKFYSKLQQKTQQPAARLQTVWCLFLETPSARVSYPELTPQHSAVARAGLPVERTRKIRMQVLLPDRASIWSSL